MTRDADLQAVRREGKRIRTGLLEVRALASPLRRSRVGIIVPRYKHTAVARNRLKRRLRELARLHVLPALADLAPADVVVRVWPSAYGAGFDALAADVGRAVRQLERGVGRRASGVEDAVPRTDPDPPGGRRPTPEP